VGLDKEIGSIEVGKKADVIAIDYSNPWMTPIHNPASAIVYSALGHEVTDVMIDGQFALRNSSLVTVNEQAVRRQAQQHADALTKRAGTDKYKHRPWRSFTI
jgi:5-methylthioadenosine/S-adenosylhomocysteine deaminase